MADQPSIIEALMAQLSDLADPITTAIIPTYGTDREVIAYANHCYEAKKIVIFNPEVYHVIIPLFCVESAASGEGHEGALFVGL
jgi:hypothetical protein